MVLCVAGFDCAHGDPLGGMEVSSQAFAHLTHLLMDPELVRVCMCTVPASCEHLTQISAVCFFFALSHLRLHALSSCNVVVLLLCYAVLCGAVRCCAVRVYRTAK